VYYIYQSPCLNKSMLIFHFFRWAQLSLLTSLSPTSKWSKRWSSFYWHCLTSPFFLLMRSQICGWRSVVCSGMALFRLTLRPRGSRLCLPPICLSERGGSINIQKEILHVWHTWEQVWLGGSWNVDYCWNVGDVVLSRNPHKSGRNQFLCLAVEERTIRMRHTNLITFRMASRRLSSSASRRKCFRDESIQHLINRHYLNHIRNVGTQTIKPILHTMKILVIPWHKIEVKLVNNKKCWRNDCFPC